MITKLKRVENAMRLAVYFEGSKDPGRFVAFKPDTTVSEFLAELGLSEHGYEVVVDATGEVVQPDALLLSSVYAQDLVMIREKA